VTPETEEILRELAELPLSVRGFGPVRAKAQARAETRRAALLAAFDAGGTPERLAAQ